MEIHKSNAVTRCPRRPWSFTTMDLFVAALGGLAIGYLLGSIPK